MVNENNRLLTWLKHRVFRTAHRLFRRRSGPLPREPRTLLVMQLQQIGDSVIFTPTMRALRQRFPNARIDLLANPVSAQLHRKSPHVNRVHVARSWRAGKGGSRLWPMRAVLRDIRRERYDVVITDLAQSSFKYSLVALLTGARARVGFDIEHRGFLYTHPLPFRPEANWVDLNLDIARAFGAVQPSTREELYADADDDAYAASLLAAAGPEDAGPLVMIHCGSNWQSRTWYEDRWAALADALVRRAGATVIFVGTSGESAMVEEVRRRMTEPSVSFAGRTTLAQLVALMRRVQLFIGTDSGPRHMAGAVGIPHITLMGSQDASDRWVGFRESETLLRTLPPCAGCGLAWCSHRTCMDLIRVGEVIDHGLRLLGKARHPLPMAGSAT